MQEDLWRFFSPLASCAPGETLAPDRIKKCASEKRWLMQRTSRGGRHFTSPGRMFQREANTNMVAHRLGCCVMDASDSDTYRLSCFRIPVGEVAVHHRWHFQAIPGSFRTSWHQSQGAFHELIYAEEYFGNCNHTVLIITVTMRSLVEALFTHETRDVRKSLRKQIWRIIQSTLECFPLVWFTLPKLTIADVAKIVEPISSPKDSNLDKGCLSNINITM